jgi:hypothetical protein
MGTMMDREVIRSSGKDGGSLIVARDGMLTSSYILPRQDSVHNPYYSALYFMLVH